MSRHQKTFLVLPPDKSKDPHQLLRKQKLVEKVKKLKTSAESPGSTMVRLTYQQMLDKLAAIKGTVLGSNPDPLHFSPIRELLSNCLTTIIVADLPDMEDLDEIQATDTPGEKEKTYLNYILLGRRIVQHAKNIQQGIIDTKLKDLTAGMTDKIISICDSVTLFIKCKNMLAKFPKSTVLGWIEKDDLKSLQSAVVAFRAFCKKNRIQEQLSDSAVVSADTPSPFQAVSKYLECLFPAPSPMAQQPAQVGTDPYIGMIKRKATILLVNIALAKPHGPKIYGEAFESLLGQSHDAFKVYWQALHDVGMRYEITGDVPERKIKAALLHTWYYSLAMRKTLNKAKFFFALQQEKPTSTASAQDILLYLKSFTERCNQFLAITTCLQEKEFPLIYFIDDLIERHEKFTKALNRKDLNVAVARLMPLSSESQRTEVLIKMQAIRREIAKYVEHYQTQSGILESRMKFYGYSKKQLFRMMSSIYHDIHAKACEKLQAPAESNKTLRAIISRESRLAKQITDTGSNRGVDRTLDAEQYELIEEVMFDLIIEKEEINRSRGTIEVEPESAPAHSPLIRQQMHDTIVRLQRESQETKTEPAWMEACRKDDWAIFKSLFEKPKYGIEVLQYACEQKSQNILRSICHQVGHQAGFIAQLKLSLQNDELKTRLLSDPSINALWEKYNKQRVEHISTFTALPSSLVVPVSTTATATLQVSSETNMEEVSTEREAILQRTMDQYKQDHLNGQRLINDIESKLIELTRDRASEKETSSWYQHVSRVLPLIQLHFKGLKEKYDGVFEIRDPAEMSHKAQLQLAKRGSTILQELQEEYLRISALSSSKQLSSDSFDEPHAATADPASPATSVRLAGERVHASSTDAPLHELKDEAHVVLLIPRKRASALTYSVGGVATLFPIHTNFAERNAQIAQLRSLLDKQIPKTVNGEPVSEIESLQMYAFSYELRQFIAEDRAFQACLDISEQQKLAFFANLLEFRSLVQSGNKHEFYQKFIEFGMIMLNCLATHQYERLCKNQFYQQLVQARPASPQQNEDDFELDQIDRLGRLTNQVLSFGQINLAHYPALTENMRQSALRALQLQATQHGDAFTANLMSLEELMLEAPAAADYSAMLGFEM